MDQIDALLKRIFTNQISVFLTVGVVLLLVAEIGYRLGLRIHMTRDELRAKQVEIVQGAVLGLMSLLLGFTYAMAVQRYDLRKKTMVDETNAIGAAYLRASHLPDAARRESENLLREYVAKRLQLIRATDKPEALAALEADTFKMQQRLWVLGDQAAHAAPSPFLNSYAQALNELISVGATRLDSLRNHVPGAVWLLLLALTSTGCSITGYRAGTIGRRTRLSLLALPLLLTMVISFVADLNNPNEGLVGLDETSLKSLQQKLGEIAETPP